MHPNKRRRRCVEEDNRGDNEVHVVCSIPMKSDIQRCPITRFEDLSNELIYEVYEYFTTNELYEFFFELNARFHNLCLHSSLPIRLHSSYLSKPAFQSFYTHLIKSNKHRVQSLRFVDPFVLDFFSSTAEDLSQCTQLQALCLTSIDSQQLQSLLPCLPALPHLSRLSMPIGLGVDTNALWNQLMQLPALKYLEIIIENKAYFNVARMSTSTSSSIEHLVIKGKLDHMMVDTILSHVPQLRRWSVDYLYGYYRHGTTPLLAVMRQLTHVSLVLIELRFEQLEPLVKAYFNQVQVLYITSSDYYSYASPQHWQTLRDAHMPFLRILDIDCIDHTPKRFEPHSLLYRRRTSHVRSRSPTSQPHRRRSYTLINEPESSEGKTECHTVRHVRIPDDKLIEHCSKYFPNATELTIADQRLDRSRRPSTIQIDSILPLQQLTKLTIDYHHRSFNKVAELLSSTPNVHRLVLQHVSIVQADYLALPRSDEFRAVASRSKVNDLTVRFDYLLEDVQLFVRFCPQLRRLSLGPSTLCADEAMRFLLTETKERSCHLALISFLDIDTVLSDRLRNLIESEKLSRDLSFKVISSSFYLWC